MFLPGAINRQAAPGVDPPEISRIHLNTIFDADVLPGLCNLETSANPFTILGMDKA